LDFLTPKKAFGFCLFLIFILFIYSQLPPPLYEAGPFPDPVQVALEKPLELKSPPGYKITATDQYSLDGLVVSVCRYRFSKESKLSPVDFAIAWGPLTKEPNLHGIHYSQDSRWYSYKYKTENINVSPQEIIHFSANNHIVVPPENESLRKFLLGVHRGDSVHLSGYLIQISASEGWNWTSSRTRTDSGNHSCELFYVTDGKKI